MSANTNPSAYVGYAPDAPEGDDATGPAPPAPTPAGPTENAAVDGRAVTLVWHPVLGVARHDIQVASDPDFEDVLFEKTAGSENAMRVSWPQVPKADGAGNSGRRFWRVRCFRHGSWGPWSKPATFRFTGKDAPPPSPAPTSVERHIPHLTGTTSGRQALAAVLVLVVGVVLIVELALLAPVGSLIDPDEAGGGTGGGAPPAFEVTPASLSDMVGTASAVTAGGQTFSTYCASCHGQQGGGTVGPNLTDNAWIHGGQNMDIYRILVEGASGAGMPAWEGTISDREMAQLVAFIRSLEGTNPPGGKGPEGDPVERGGNASGDTTTTAATRR